MKWSKLLSLCYYCSKGFPGTASSNSAMSVHSAVIANTQRSTDKGGSSYKMFVFAKTPANDIATLQNLTSMINHILT